jgi:MOSC domain-containing protein YiiM
MNERNVCIGDVISVGDEVLLEVSLPRQPCFKLNHRFGLKNFAPVTYRTSRTGWYYVSVYFCGCEDKGTYLLTGTASGS